MVIVDQYYLIKTLQKQQDSVCKCWSCVEIKLLLEMYIIHFKDLDMVEYLWIYV